MRRGFVVVVVLGVVVGGLLTSHAEIGNTFGCTASQPVAISAVNAPSPTCSFDVACPGGCFMLVQLDVNGGGQVSGAMSAAPLFSDEVALWVDANSNVVDAPTCEGLFSCSAGTRSTSGSDASPLLLLSGFAKVTCSGGGLAVFESISCSTTVGAVM